MDPQESVVVTGGARGIGAALTERLAAAGRHVVVLERDVSDTELSSGPRVRLIRGDATDRADLDAACAAAAKVAPLTGFVANAGFNRPGPSADLPRDDWDAVVEINLSAVFWAAQAAYAHRGDGLSFVALSSFAGLRGLPGRTAYCAAKAGIGGLVRTLATEWGADGVRANAVCPGFVETRLVAEAFRAGTMDPDLALNRIPLARFARADEVAAVIAFLLSQDASYVTGAMLPVDGGISIQGLAP